MDQLSGILSWMESRRDTKNVEGMERFGINNNNAFGIPTPELKRMSKEIGRNHSLALRLWDTGFHEARILASMVADPAVMNGEEMDKWCSEFDSWDICDQCCLKLFRYTPYALEKILEWAGSDEQFVKRAAFALIACCAVEDKNSPDSKFEAYFDLITDASEDDRNFVRKAVNWALRQIGKRNMNLYFRALQVSEDLMVSKNKTARWIGSDATRDLTSPATMRRLSRIKE